MDKYSQAQEKILGLARLYKEEGLYKKAIEQFERYLYDYRNETEYKLFKEIAVCHSLEGNQKKAIDYFLMYLEEEETDVEAIYYLAQLYNELRDYENALKYCIAVLNINNKVIPVFFLLSEIYERLDKPDKVEKCLINVQELEPNNSYFRYILGEFYLRNKKYKNAKESLKMARKLDLTNKTIYLKLAEAHKGLNEKKKAKSELKTYLNLVEKDFKAYKMFLELLSESEINDEENRIIKSNNSLSKIKLGLLYKVKGQKDAKEILNESLKLKISAETKKFLKDELNDIK